jgi:hypothetical protein
MDGMSNLRSCGAALSNAIKTRKELASSLASGPSLGYLMHYERIELLGSDTTARDIFSQGEKPE